MVQTATKWTFLTPDKDLFAIWCTDRSTFSATILGSPTSTQLTYQAPQQEGCLSDGSYYGTNFGRMLLYNVTKGTSRKILFCDASANIIHTESSTDDWGDGDSIRIKDPTINSATFFALDISDAVPIDTIGVMIHVEGWECCEHSALVEFHPISSYSVSKKQTFQVREANNQHFFSTIISCTNQKIGMSWYSVSDFEVTLKIIAYMTEVQIPIPVTSRLVSPKGIRIP